MDNNLQFPFRALGFYNLAFHGGSNAFGECNGVFTNTGHGFSSFSLEHLAEHFAAHIRGFRLVVSHHALRGGQDFNAKAVVELRQTFDLRVNTAARGGNALEFSDDRLAGIVFQLNLQFFSIVATSATL